MRRAVAAPTLLIGLALLPGCDATDNGGAAAARTPEAQAIAAAAPTPVALPKTMAPPKPAAVPAAAMQSWRSPDGAIALQYPRTLSPSQDFSATYFTPAGWRATFDGAPMGPGHGLVRFTAESLSQGNVPRIAADTLQIGISADQAVVADCLTRGLQGGRGTQAPSRIIGGVRFTTWRGGDAGMSHQLSSTDWRAVHHGTCIAIDWLTRSVPASVDVNAHPGRPRADVEKDFNSILASLMLN